METLMQYNDRSYPRFSACGLNCGLCPRHYTQGTSRCPGCAGVGFAEVHPSCGVLSCVQRKGIEYCFECDEYPCSRFDNIGQKDSFISHLHQLADLEKAKSEGIEAYQAELDGKVAILETLLSDYDDGRRKSFYCLAANLLSLEDMQEAIRCISTEVNDDDPVKEKAIKAVAILEEIADRKGITLKLRK
jgi:hypothetical protein